MVSVVSVGPGQYNEIFTKFIYLEPDIIPLDWGGEGIYKSSIWKKSLQATIPTYCIVYCSCFNHIFYFCAINNVYLCRTRNKKTFLCLASSQCVATLPPARAIRFHSTLNETPIPHFQPYPRNIRPQMAKLTTVMNKISVNLFIRRKLINCAIEFVDLYLLTNVVGTFSCYLSYIHLTTCHTF